MAAYLRGEASLAEAVARFELATHAYIRRQLSWFRPDKRIHWLDATLAPAALATLAQQVALTSLHPGHGPEIAPE